MAEQAKKKGFFGEFKEFIARGNVMDMAVGIIVGGAFQKIVTSLVNDVVNPIVGFFINGKEFADLAITLKPDDPATEAVETVAIKYGQFLQTALDFLITAFVVFCLVKGINRLCESGGKREEKACGGSRKRGLIASRDKLSRFL